ncbi:MAG: hypothetical protein K9I36_05195 [Bacteroidia bacterium]|nr:hypothetical protein [Bacteroidia bacterium]MCF8426104.1 hypothetical protein [Bacteroidia bacterium]
MSKRILFYTAFTFSIELLMFILSVFRIHNLALIHFAIPLDFYLMSLVFLEEKLLQNFKKLFWTALALIVVVGVYETIWVNHLSSFPSITIVVESMLLVAAVFLYFNESLKVPSAIPLSLQPLFWVACAILVYYGFSVFYFLLYNRIHLENKIKIGSILHSSFNTLYYLLLTIGIICKKERAI